MISAVRYFIAFPLILLWAGVRLIGAALIRHPHRPGGIYDRSARDFGTSLMRSSRVKAVVQGREHLDPNRPCVYIVNHSSFIDIWALLEELPGTVRFVFKAELTRVPVLGQALLAARHIRINRQSRSAAFAAYDEAAKSVQAGISAIVFPEGTRSPDGKLTAFKKGPFVLAIAAGVPVVPILIEGAFELMPGGALYPRPGTVTLRVGAPIQTTGMSYHDRDRLAVETTAALEAMAPLVSRTSTPSTHPGSDGS